MKCLRLALVLFFVYVTTTSQPTEVPTDDPTEGPTNAPTIAPSLEPTDYPSEDPTHKPTVEPTQEPTEAPTEAPTEDPTGAPTDVPSNFPSDVPTDAPTNHPTDPTHGPTDASAGPTSEPTKPTNFPTKWPTESPTVAPTIAPSQSPSHTPTDEPTLAPTTSPTDFPTSSPSQHPTITPTSFPTNETSTTSSEETMVPSVDPSGNPTHDPSAEPTIVPSGAPTATTAAASESETASDGTISQAATYFIIFLGVFGVVCVLLHFIVKKCVCQRADRPSYGGFLMYLQNVGDFWTDVLFCVVMILRGESTYSALALTFTILPLLSTMILLAYHIQRWRVMSVSVNQRIKDYLAENTKILIVLALLGSFASTLSLIQSRILPIDLFCFPLKRKESDRLTLWKFLNTTLVENVPQFVIQLHYLANNENSGDTNDLIVYLSLTLTILSLLVSITYAIVIIMSIKVEYNSKVIQATEIEIKLCLVCPGFGREHAFSHKSIKTCLFNALQTKSLNEELQNLWEARTDTTLSAEVFYINNKIEYKDAKELDVFCLFTLSSYSDFSEKHNAPTHLQAFINEFGNNGGSIQAELIEMLENKLNCRPIRVKSNQIMSSTTTAFEQNANANVVIQLVSLATGKTRNTRTSHVGTFSPSAADTHETVGRFGGDAARLADVLAEGAGARDVESNALPVELQETAQHGEGENVETGGGHKSIEIIDDDGNRKKVDHDESPEPSFGMYDTGHKTEGDTATREPHAQDATPPPADEKEVIESEKVTNC